MRWTSALAIFALFWALSIFFVLPFHARRGDATSGAEPTPGEDRGAPPGFRAGRAAIHVTLVAGLLFGLFYINYVRGYITAEDLNLFRQPQ